MIVLVKVHGIENGGSQPNQSVRFGFDLLASDVERV
jgi:hypothetical protein